MRASLVSPSKPDANDDLEVEYLLCTPFIEALAFGESAERAVAPRAMEFAVGEA